MADLLNVLKDKLSGKNVKIVLLKERTNVF